MNDMHINETTLWTSFHLVMRVITATYVHTRINEKRSR